MRILSTFPRKVRVIENTWIPLTDGTRLAARVWLPEDAEAAPVPAVLEYIPYRKRDRTRERDEPMHHYFAGHGYASVRVDLRGTGDSEGLLLDEYHAQEIDDGIDVIEFLARQPWCTGRVGMMGKSWGGFNALQVAARRPGALGAIVTVCASDDRYTDDAHYMGGCLLNENLVWGSALFTLVGLPPDPDVCGAEWRARWMDRLAKAEPFAAEWLRHPHRDDYWKHGSVRDDYSQIECAVYAVGGWADAYTNAIPRLLSGLRSPKKGLIGPWAHVYPHNGVPGPAIGFLQETVRWWDRWLKNDDNGIMEEPMLHAWLSGRWVAEPSWPSPNIAPRVFSLPLESSDREPIIDSTDLVGASSGSWCAFGGGDELPSEQSGDDARSFVLDLPPLEEPVEFLGAPVIRLKVASDRPHGMLAVRLNDVAPDGRSTRVTYALLDLTHRHGHDGPDPMVPGRFEDVRIQLNAAAHRFEAGHRLRVALSGSYWPIAWPTSEPFVLRLQSEVSLELPIRRGAGVDEPDRGFPPPESAPPAETVELDKFVTRSTVQHDPATGAWRETVTTDLRDDGTPAMTRILATGVEHGHSIREEFRIVEGSPSTATAEIVHDAVFRRIDGSWNVRVETRHRLTGSRSELTLEADLAAQEDGEEVFRRSFKIALPRN